MSSQPSDEADAPLIPSAAGWALLAMLFLTGFVLMGFEMLGSRYLNPWFGGGITTWASLISVVLLAMMVGYMGGGTVADRSGGLAPMAIAIAVAGLYMFGVAAVANDAMDALVLSVGDGFWGVLTGSFILCFVPIICLSGCSPYVVKLLLTRVSHGGRITGLVYSISTAGNILGTLATVFWFIPNAGTRTMTYAFGGTLIVLALVLLAASPMRRKLAAASAAALFGLLIVVDEPALAETRRVDALYPEGPVWDGGSLLYAEMTAGRVSRLAGGKRSDFWAANGCGPTAITPFGADTFAVNCHLGGGIALLGRDGKLRQSVLVAEDGRKLRNPNDINSQGGGPVFFSDPGLFSPSAEPSGRVYRLAPDGQAHLVHEGLHYPNGVAFDARSRQLFVSEHLAQKVWRFSLAEDWSITKSEVVLDRDDLLAGIEEPSPYTGPDGLRIDTDGTLHVAIYGAGRIVSRAPDGSVVHRFVPMRYVTSLALSEERIAIVGAHSNSEPPFRGSVLVIDRETFEASDRLGF